jgi:SAM domain (Sterile alpha motif)
MQEIADWLEKLGMSEYAQRFAEQRIDFSVLPALTDADLKDLGVVLGDRRKILRAIVRLDATSETAVLMPSTLQAVQESPTAEGSSEQRDVTLYGIAQATEGENPKANYHRLIACAVKELDRSTSEARDAVYERARTALIAHLRLNQAGLLKADVVKERLALEGAIREIEAEAARKSRTEMPTALRPKTPPASTPNVDGSSHQSSGPADVPEARLPAVLSDEQSLGRQSLLEAVRGSRDVVSEVHGFAGIIGTAAQTGPHARQVREEEAVGPQPSNRVDFDKRQERDHGPYGSEDEQLLVVPPLRLLSRSAAPEGERSSLAQHGLARLLVVVISVTAVMATIFWQWSAVTEFYQFLNHTGSESRGQVSHKTPTAQSKISRGVAQQQSSADARGAMVPRGQTVPTVGQRVVLYEEDQTDPQGKRYTGAAIVGYHLRLA